MSERSNSACRSLGQSATSVADGLGLSAQPVQVVDTVDVALHAYTAPVSCSPVGIAMA
jgi:hypothetical protein